MKESSKKGLSTLIRRLKRLFSSNDVLDFLGRQSDGSINRINIDYGFPGKEVITECMRVLEPGGAIEFGTVEAERQKSERAFTEMRLKFRETEVTPLDFKSGFLRASLKYSKTSPNDKPIKYIIEKPGGGPEVDCRMFYERLTPELRARLP